MLSSGMEAKRLGTEELNLWSSRWKVFVNQLSVQHHFPKMCVVASHPCCGRDRQPLKHLASLPWKKRSARRLRDARRTSCGCHHGGASFWPWRSTPWHPKNPWKNYGKTKTASLGSLAFMRKSEIFGLPFFFSRTPELFSGPKSCNHAIMPPKNHQKFTLCCGSSTFPRGLWSTFSARDTWAMSRRPILGAMQLSNRNRILANPQLPKQKPSIDFYIYTYSYTHISRLFIQLFFNLSIFVSFYLYFFLSTCFDVCV